MSYSSEQLHKLAKSGKIPSNLTAADLCVMGSNGTSALHAAAYFGHLDQIKGGVTAKILANTIDSNGSSALLWAAKNGHLDQIKNGVTAKQLAANKNKNGWTALHAAAMMAHLNQIKSGLNITILAKTINNSGQSALLTAVAKGSYNQIPGGVTTQDLAKIALHTNGYTALHAAADHKNLPFDCTLEALTETQYHNGTTALACLDDRISMLNPTDLKNLFKRLNSITDPKLVQHIANLTKNINLVETSQWVVKQLNHLTCTDPKLLKEFSVIAMPVNPVATTLWLAKQINNLPPQQQQTK